MCSLPFLPDVSIASRRCLPKIPLGGTRAPRRGRRSSRSPACTARTISSPSWRVWTSSELAVHERQRNAGQPNPDFAALIWAATYQDINAFGAPGRACYRAWSTSSQSSGMSTLLLSHPACLDHLTPMGHPERPDRLRAVERALEHEKFQGLARDQAPMATVEMIALAHPMDYVEQVRQASPKEGMIRLDADTTMSPGSFEAA